MTQPETSQLQEQYDQCIAKVNALASHLKILSSEHQLQALQQIMVPEDYLLLLANSLYSINSLAFSYCNVKSINFPPEFAKVKEYYNKAKNPLSTEKTSTPSVVVNKQAVARIIERSLQ